MSSRVNESITQLHPTNSVSFFGLHMTSDRKGQQLPDTHSLEVFVLDQQTSNHKQETDELMLGKTLVDTHQQHGEPLECKLILVRTNEKIVQREPF